MRFLQPTTLIRAYHHTGNAASIPTNNGFSSEEMRSTYNEPIRIEASVGSTGKGILIGMLTAFGTAIFAGILIAVVYFFRYTRHGRIFLDRIGRPGEYDDEQAFAKEEAEALEEMDEMQRTEYMRAKAFIQANPPESAQTDISLSQFLAIQEKGVSAWEFEPELEIANCFVEARTEIQFDDTVCSVQSNLPVPKQNEVYYWEAKIFDKPESTMIGIGMTTKPYPPFRLPGYHKQSVAYTSPGSRRYNQPFTPTPYGPAYVQGDVIGVGYRPRTGTVFFTRNGKKLEDVAHGLKTQNFFPTVGADGPCQVHVNFGQMGFVFIEANVKKWGLAPMTGTLAPPPPYGSEQGSILLEGGREGVREGMGGYIPAGLTTYSHGRSASAQMRLSTRQPHSPGPQRTSTEISLAHLSPADSYADSDTGEGTSASSGTQGQVGLGFDHDLNQDTPEVDPPEYESPESTPDRERTMNLGIRNGSGTTDEERQRLLPPIPSYDAAMAQSQYNTARGRSSTR